MVQLDEKNKFASQTNLGWTFTFEVNGKYPMIANRIFATKAGAEAFIADTTANATAIPGLILRVIEDTTIGNNGAYLVEKDSEAASGLKLTRIGALDIFGEIVDVIYYEGDATHDAGFYNKSDGSGEPWFPSKNAQHINDEQVTDEGKYFCLVLNNTDKVYIKSTLSDYYTAIQVDDKINMLDSSVSDALEDIREYVNTQDDILDEKINSLDSSLNNLTDDLTGVHEILDDIEARHETDIERIDEHLNSIDVSIEYLKFVDPALNNKIEDVSRRLANTVNSISTEGDYIHVNTSKDDVTFTIDVIDSSDQTTFPSRGLVTDGYVEKRLDVFNWDVV